MHSDSLMGSVKINNAIKDLQNLTVFFILAIWITIKIYLIKKTKHWMINSK